MVVIQAARISMALDRPATANGASSLSRPMGVTPKQTSNLLYLRRVGTPNRSLLYRRAEQRFAFGGSSSSLTSGCGQAQGSGGRPIHCTALAHLSGKRWLVRLLMRNPEC